MPRGDFDSDEQLATRAASGDRRALEVLLERHSDRVVAICRRVLTNPDDARDAAQEALILVARNIGRFDGRARFTTWLHRVATNAALDEVRRRNRRPRPVETLPIVLDDTPSLSAGVVDRIVIDDAMAVIPEEFRAAVVLRDVMGLDYAEIAEVLEIPPGTVRSRIARGRAALADRLRSTGSDDDHTSAEESDESTILGNQTPGADRLDRTP